MSVKHYPYYGGAFDRIVFDGDGSVWVPEAKYDSVYREHTKTLVELGDAYDRVDELWDENRKLRELVEDMWHDGMCDCDEIVAPRGQCHCAECEYHYPDRMRDLGIEVDA